MKRPTFFSGPSLFNLPDFGYTGFDFSLSTSSYVLSVARWSVLGHLVPLPVCVVVRGFSVTPSMLRCCFSAVLLRCFSNNAMLLSCYCAALLSIPRYWFCCCGTALLWCCCSNLLRVVFSSFLDYKNNRGEKKKTVFKKNFFWSILEKLLSN